MQGAGQGANACQHGGRISIKAANFMPVTFAAIGFGTAPVSGVEQPAKFVILGNESVSFIQ